MVKLYRRLIIFINREIWNNDFKNHNKFFRILVNVIKISYLSIKGFLEDKCSIKASALTYFTLLSIVPVLGLAFGISKGFGLDNLLISELTKLFSGQEEMLAKILEFTNSLLKNTKGGVIFGFGVIILLWTVIKLLSNVENSFNHIWQITKPRSVLRKLTDYLSIMLLAPIFLAVSGSINIFIKKLDIVIPVFGNIGPFANWLLNFSPYVLIILLFTMVYLVMPNTRVKFKSALIAGIIAGILYQLTQFVYINFQVGVTKYNAIYGGFAALPLFFIWSQLSWLIILLGAEIAFSVQNIKKYRGSLGVLSPKETIVVSIDVLAFVIRKFKKGESVSSNQISKELNIPLIFTEKIIHYLIQLNIFSEVLKPNSKEKLFQPAIDSEALNLSFLLDKFVNINSQRNNINTQSHIEIKQKINKILESIEHSELNTQLVDFSNDSK